MNATELIGELAARCRFPDGHLHCAVSGGADSLALLMLAVHVRGAPHVTAWHVDHGLRAASDSEASLVQRVALQVGAGFESRTVTVQGSSNIEARARDARYAVLPDGVCTGHTADDLAETVLANLLRGAGMDGLSPMQRSTQTRVHRPMLGLRRSETKLVCAQIGVVPFADPMNEDPAFLRTRIRHRLMPVLDEVAQRDVAAVLARSAEVIAADVAILDALADEIDPTDARALRVAPEALARRSLRRWMTEAGIDTDRHPPTLATIDRAMAVVRGEAIGCDLLNGWRLTRTQQRLTLVRPGDR